MSGTSRWKPWVVLCVSFLINLIIGILYIWSIISKSLVNDLRQGIAPIRLHHHLCHRYGDIGSFRHQRPRITATIASVLLESALSCQVFLSPVMLVVTFGHRRRRHRHGECGDRSSGCQGSPAQKGMVTASLPVWDFRRCVLTAG